MAEKLIAITQTYDAQLATRLSTDRHCLLAQRAIPTVLLAMTIHADNLPACEAFVVEQGATEPASDSWQVNKLCIVRKLKMFLNPEA